MATGIQVDITNPRDIQTKLNRLRNQIVATEKAIVASKDQLESLRQAEGRLAILAGEKPPEAENRPSSVERVITALEKIGGPATVGEISNALDPPMKRKTVGWALWQAAQDRRINKPGTGVYAPASYNPVELKLNGGQT